ncbi:hypothetical protein BJ912DRAFT_982151 [Pholiota molesta]|nr:hypothetical protein BJ912DRAFT_982151 [Pholiota molesta]
MACHRTPFYGMAVFTAFLQSVFGIIAGFVNGNSPYLYIFGKLAGGSILFRFNRRPQSTNPLSRSYAHFVSFTFLAVVWLAVGIMLATQMPWECSAKTLWCAAASFSSALAFCISFFSTGAAVMIHRAAARSGAGLSVNVAQIEKRELPVDDMIY